MIDDLYSFEEAKRRLLEDPDQCSFAVYPGQIGREYVKATVFLLVSQEDEGDTHLNLYTETGQFFTSSDEEDIHDVFALGDEADRIRSLYGIDPRSLRYKACTEDQIFSAMDVQIEHAIALLNGRPEDTPRFPDDLPDVWDTWLTQHAPAN